METRPNLTNATLRKFDHSIRDQKFLKLLKKLASNFASLLFYGSVTKLITNFINTSKIQVSVRIKFGKGLCIGFIDFND